MPDGGRAIEPGQVPAPNPTPTPTPIPTPTPTPTFPSSESELGILSKIDFSFLDNLALGAKPDANGAIQRNKQGYFHVRFQLGLSSLFAAGLTKKDTSFLSSGVKAIEYAFQYQNPDGTFQLIVPPGTEGIPTDPTELEYVKASGVAFFYADLGRALLLMKESGWFQTSSETASLRNRIETLRLAIAQSLNKLATQTSSLKLGDERDTNRLFFDATAFYLVGTWINDEKAVGIGKDFLSMALGKQRPDGVFIEAGGYDSSYQATSLTRAMSIFLHLRPQEESTRTTLWQSIQKGIEWEKTRILPTGEVSTEGNTRVFPGGGTFLGKEKVVDVKGVVFVLHYYAVIVGENSFHQLADNVLKFYSQQSR